MNREVELPSSQEYAVPQATESNEFDGKETQKDSQKEDLKEESLLVQIPIPRKWDFFHVRIWEIYLSEYPTSKNQ